MQCCLDADLFVNDIPLIDAANVLDDLIVCDVLVYDDVLDDLDLLDVYLYMTLMSILWILFSFCFF